MLILFLLIFQCSRLYFICYNLSLFHQGFVVAFFKTAAHGFWLDLSAIAYCLAPFLIIDLFKNITKKNAPKWLVKTILSLQFILVFLLTISDAELFLQWGNKFNSQVLVYVTHPIEMALSARAVNFVKTIFYGLILCILLFILFNFIFKIIIQQTLELKLKNSVLVLLFMGLNFVMLRCGLGVTAISQSSAIFSDKSIDNAASINSLWNAVYYIFTNTENIYGHKLNYLSDVEAHCSIKNQILMESRDTLSLTNVAKPNVIIIMLESFTANASKYFSGNNYCTPNLDNIAKENLSFMQCYASGDRTEKGLVSVLSGYPAQPSSSIIVFPDKMAKLPSISKSLKAEAYTNLFVYGGDCNFASMKSYLLVQKFDEIVDKKDFETNQLNSKWGAHDGFLFDKALASINKIKTPFFSTIMTLSSHEPFEVPFQATNLKKDEWYGFKNSIQYADRMLFEFLEKCKRMPWYKNTVILLVADHGHDIGLKDVQYFGKEKYHIPMIITGGALKKELKGTQINTVVSQTIIPELLLSSMNIKMEVSEFYWQTTLTHGVPFAQYHFNNGFGRVWQNGSLIFDNDSKKQISYFGDSAKRNDYLFDGKGFQQSLIKDFLQK